MKPLTTLGETPAALPGTPLSGSTTNSQIFLKAKFLLCAGFGIFMFLCPLGGDSFNTPLSLLTDAIDKFISTNLPWFLTALVVLSAVSGLLGQFVLAYDAVNMVIELCGVSIHKVVKGQFVAL